MCYGPPEFEQTYVVDGVITWGMSGKRNRVYLQVPY